MSDARQDSQLGSKNSQFGTCWVKKDKISLKIKLDQLEKFVQEGYVRGRTMKSPETSRRSNENY
jgi:hypothetical protein